MFYLCGFLTADENYVEPTQRICQNLFKTQRVTRCIAQPGNLPYFFEQAFPVDEVDLPYTQAAMSGFEVVPKKRYDGTQVNQYDLVFLRYVRFTFSNNQLKNVEYCAD